MRKPSARWVILALAILALGAFAAATGYRLRQTRVAAAVLSRAAEMSPAACYAATTETQAVFCGRVVSGTARLLRRGRDMWRVEYLNAPATGILVGSNGQVQWRLVPGRDVTIVSASAPEDLAWLVKNYRARHTGYETIAGRPAYAISLFDSSGRLARRLFVDRDRFVVLRTQVFDGRGTLIAQTTVKQIDFLPEVPVELFTVPADYWPPVRPRPSPRQCQASLAALQKAAGFPVRPPRWLPESYRLKSACILHGSAACGCRVVHLNYSDGVRSLSIFEAPACHHESCPFSLRPGRGAGAAGQPVHYGPGTAFTDVQGTPVIIAFGDLPPDQLQKVVHSAR